MSTTRKFLLVVVLITAGLNFYVAYDKFGPNREPQETTTPETQEEVLLPEEIQEEFTLKHAVASITAEELKEDTHHIASDDFEGRMSGQPGNDRAAEWIKAELEELGLKTEYQQFSTRSGSTNNIFGWIEGSDPNLKDEIVVIGGHMDHIGKDRRGQICNGADDNASGTVAVLEIAEAFSMIRDKMKRTVVFQLYSGEELGLIGSKHYCSNPTFPKGSPSMRSHVFMLNLDMIGTLGSGVYLTNFGSDERSGDISKIISELSGKYSCARTVTSQGRGSNSDHASFRNKGVPVVFLHTGLHSRYHKSTDDPDTLNYEGMEEITRYACELAYRVITMDSRPTLNVDIPFPETSDLDHGKEPFLKD